MTAPGRPEDGMSLIEVLITIVVLGLAGVALLGGMSAGITGSDVHRKQASIETVLASAGEALLDPKTGYVNCATDYPSVATSVTFPKTSSSDNSWSPSDVQILKVEYWDGSTFSANSASCKDNAGAVKLQRVTIQVTSPDGHVQRQRQFIKGNAEFLKGGVAG